jgi:hypothetical protein
VGDVTLNHRHWQTRVKLIAFARQLSTRADFEVPAVSFPRFTELEGAVAEHIDEWVRGNDHRLAALSELVRQGREKAGETPLIEDLSLTRVALGRIDGTGSKLRQADVAELCEAHAAVWQAFGKCVTDRGEDPAIVLQAIETLICRWEAIKLGFAGVGAVATTPQRPLARWRSGLAARGIAIRGDWRATPPAGSNGHGRPTPSPRVRN